MTSDGAASQPSEQSAAAVWTLFRRKTLTPLVISSFALFFYGLYIILFRLCLVILRKRERTRERLFHHVALTALFVLASIGVPLGLGYDILAVAIPFWSLAGLGFPMALRRAQLIIQIIRYVTLLFMSFTIDSILIFRFFVLFGYRKKYIVIPIFFCFLVDLGATATGILDAVGSLGASVDTHWVNFLGNVANSFVGCIALYNFLLTTAIAGKIWWASRRHGGGNVDSQTTQKRFQTVISILLESGLLYFLAMALFIAGDLLGDNTFDSGSILTQVSGIAPTLMVVRANMSERNGEEGNEASQDLRFHYTSRGTNDSTRAEYDIDLENI